MMKIAKSFMALLAGMVLLFSGCEKDDDDTIAVTGVGISKPTLELLIGASETLTATVKPENATNQSVVWSGNNDEVATVDPATGKITAIAAGDVVITVTTEDGGKTATCALTVKKEDNVLNEITDPAFKAYVTYNMANASKYNDPTDDYTDKEQPAWDTDGDGKLSVAEAATVKCINVGTGYNDEKIESLAGIEYFTGLEILNCHANYLEELDLSNLKSLKSLNFSSSSLTELNVSGCESLIEIFGFNNALTSLDLSDCSALTNLNCAQNSLTSLKVQNCDKLGDLDCGMNSLASLDISGCTALTRLVCSDNQLTGLNISANINLSDLTCNNNQLTELDITSVTSPFFFIHCGSQSGNFKLKMTSYQKHDIWDDYLENHVENEGVEIEVVNL